MDIMSKCSGLQRSFRRSFPRSFPRCLPLVAVAAALLVSACTTVPDSIVTLPPTVKPKRADLAPAASGAIFQSAAYRPLLEDRRARMVGDTLTIVINEKTAAGKAAGSSASKTGSVSAGIPNILGTNIKELGATANTSNKYEDKGNITSSNSFTGQMGVTVVDVLENGNLVVSGEKQVALDKGVEYVRFSGVISPDTIQTGNIVSSTTVADARVEYRTNSRVDVAEVMSSLSRFFFSVLPF